MSILRKMSGLLRKLSVVGRKSHLHCTFRSYSSVGQRPARALIRQTNRIDSAFLGVQPIFDSTIRSKKFLVKTKDDGARTAKILSTLSSGVVSLPFANFNHMHKTMLKNYSISIDDGFTILRSCSQLVDRNIEDRIKLVDEAIQALEILIGEPKRNHLIAFIRAFRRSGKQSMDDYGSFFQKFNCPLDIEIFEELMYWACQNDDSMSNAMKILDDMKAKSINYSEKIYGALIVGYGKQSIDALEKVLHEMEEAGIFKTSLTYTELIKAYLCNKQDEKALELFENYDKLSTDQLYEIIRGGVHRRNEKIIIKSLNRLPSPIRNAATVAPELQNICIEAIYANDNRTSDDQIDPYYLIIRHLPKPEMENINGYNYGKFLLKEMIAKNEQISKIFDLCKELMTSGRSERPFHLCCVLALRFHNPQSPEFLKALKNIEPLRPHYFWPLFCQAKNDEEVLNVIRLAKELETDLNSDTYLNFVLPRLATLIDPQQIYQLLKENGAIPSALKTAFIAFLVQKNRLEDALAVARQSKSSVNPTILLPSFLSFFASGRFENKSAIFIAEMMKVLQKKSFENGYDLAGQLCMPIPRWDTQLVLKLIKAYDKAGVKISRNSANIILQKLEKNRSLYGSFEPIIRELISDELFPDVHEQQERQSNESTIESLEDQLTLLTANGFPVHGVLHKLFSKYIQLRRYNDALRIEKMFHEVGVLETAVYLAKSIQLHTDLKDAHKAVECWKKLQMKYSSFKIDAYKLIDLASLLIENDRYDEAINVLNSKKPENSKAIIDSIAQNVLVLLSAAREYAVRNGKSENVSGQLMEILSKKKLCKTSNVNLGQIVKEFVEKKDLRNAITYHLKFAEKYNETPQSLALIIELIKILELGDKPNDFQINKSEATEFLQNVLDADTSAHGSTKANVKLILALAFNRNYNQLRKLMLNPDLKFDSKHMIESLKYFSCKSNRIDIVISIAQSVRDLMHTGLSETILYEILLAQFVKNNDYESAIDFFNKIVVQNNAILPKAIAKKLADFLERNEQEIPEKLQSLIY